jgi:excisionase family DNA binding protein
MKSVSEFAALKGISRERVYALIRANQIPYRRIGHSLLIENAALDWSPQRSRPLSVRMAAALALYLEGGSNDDLRSSETTRIAAYARRLFESQDPARLLSAYMAGRAQRFSYSIAADDLSDLRHDTRLTMSGVSSPVSRMSAPDVVEGYISEHDLPMLVQEFLLRDADDGNVILRVPAFAAPVGPVFIAADLADWNRPRELRQSRELIRGLNRAINQHGDS